MSSFNFSSSPWLLLLVLLINGSGFVAREPNPFERKIHRWRTWTRGCAKCPPRSSLSGAEICTRNSDQHVPGEPVSRLSSTSGFGRSCSTGSPLSRLEEEEEKQRLQEEEANGTLQTNVRCQLFSKINQLWRCCATATVYIVQSESAKLHASQPIKWLNLISLALILYPT